MKKRSPLAVFILGLVTFGIYDLYWLIKTKQVLNKNTKHHTPTIWLLILPSIILFAGYIVLFVSSFQADVNSPSTSSGSSGSSVLYSSNSVSGSGEQLSSKGQTRPTQYKHICVTTDEQQYVSQGNPNCLGSDSYRGDYGNGVPGTLYSSPCKTTGGTVRYVYVAQGESCPDNTSLVFYNNACPADATSSDQCSTSNGRNTFLDGSGTDTSSNVNPGMLLAAIGLIAIGFPLTFAISIFWFFRFSKAINEYTRGKMSTAVTFLILWLVHLVGVALIQDTFNEIEEEGAGAAMGPPAPVANPAPGYPPATSAPTPSTGTVQPHAQQPTSPPAPPADNNLPSISEEPQHDHHSNSL